MADWTILNLTTAVVGVTTTVSFQVQSTAFYTQSVSNGTRNVGSVSASNFNIVSNTTSATPAKRPGTGQVFPRGVYNK